ncbi:MAG: hypothetical protein AAF621_06135, partial [Pseudomonadota bacterium]
EEDDTSTSRLEQILEVIDAIPSEFQLEMINILLDEMDEHDPDREDLQRILLAQTFILAAGTDGEDNAPSDRLADTLSKFDKEILEDYGYNQYKVDKNSDDNLWLASAFDTEGMYELFAKDGPWAENFPDAGKYSHLVSRIFDVVIDAEYNPVHREDDDIVVDNWAPKPHRTPPYIPAPRHPPHHPHYRQPYQPPYGSGHHRAYHPHDGRYMGHPHMGGYGMGMGGMGMGLGGMGMGLGGMGMGMGLGGMGMGLGGMGMGMGLGGMGMGGYLGLGSPFSMLGYF